MNDHASKLKGLTWIAAACVLGAGFALGLSPLAHAVPWSWEKKLGKTLAWDEPQKACPVNPRAEALLKRLVDRLYPVQPDDTDFSVDVTVVKDNVINAYATLGGKISVNSGLLKQAKSPEELAGVLAHEMGHVHHRHIMQGVIARIFTAQGMSMVFGADTSMSQWANYFMTMDFTRAQEQQADEDGLLRLQKSHIDNQGFKRFFERMGEQSAATAFLSDHPSNKSRMEMVDNFPNDNVTPIMGADEWKVLKGYCRE